MGRDNRADGSLLAKPLARMGRVCVKMGQLEKGLGFLELSLKECEVDSVVKEVARIKKMMQGD